MQEKILEINNLETGYNEIKVLKGISVYLRENERIGIFGPNGHGKTTLLKTISGLLRPWRGKILFRGEDITSLNPLEIIDKGIIQVPQGNKLFPRMTVLENLKLGAYSKRAYKGMKKSLQEVFEIFTWLWDRKNQKCQTLSGGQRQMLAIAVGLMARGKILMLDEPTLGLAPKIKYELKIGINKIIESTGISLIMVEQDLKFLMKFTNRMYLIKQGRNIAEMNKDNMMEDKQILETYFGSKDL